MWPFEKTPGVEEYAIPDIAEPDKNTAYAMYHGITFMPKPRDYFAAAVRPYVNFFLKLADAPLIKYREGWDISQWATMHRQIKKYYEEKYGESI